jgi:hypothetical protein
MAEFFNKLKIGRMRTAVLRLYEQHKEQDMLPTSARFLYYELTKATDYQRMIAALTDLREQGYIPWEDIVDETRELTEWSVHDSVGEALKERWQYAKLDLWEGAPPPVIICESRSLSGILENLASEYQAPITSTVGQVAGFLHTTLGKALHREGQIVLYLGDWDFSGGHIEQNSRRVLEEIVAHRLRWERVAITERQVVKHDLPKIMKKDKRTNKTHPSVETEALGQRHIIRLLRHRLAQILPEGQRNRVLAKQKREQLQIAKELGYSTEGIFRFPRD